MSEKLEKIRDFCCECGGEGKTSHCCQDELDDDRCTNCGRYCKKDVCGYCEGRGYTEYHVGDEVEVFVCVYSDDYLKDQLYKPKAVGDTKTFQGKILGFEDRWNALVKIGRKKVRVKIDDLTMR